MRRTFVIAAAAAVVVTIGVVSAVAFIDGSEPPREPIVAAPTDSQGPGTGATQPPIIDPGMMQCVELTVETLAMVETAFDGTVTEANEDQTEVTFSVNRWYRGGGGDTVELEGWGKDSEVILHGTDLDLSVGRRALITADRGKISACGFSMPYTEENAAMFEEAFGK